MSTSLSSPIGGNVVTTGGIGLGAEFVGGGGGDVLVGGVGSGCAGVRSSSLVKFEVVSGVTPSSLVPFEVVSGEMPSKIPSKIDETTACTSSSAKIEDKFEQFIRKDRHTESMDLKYFKY